MAKVRPLYHSRAACCLATPQTSSMGWNLGRYGGAQMMNQPKAMNMAATLDASAEGCFSLTSSRVA